jgi:serine/threonine protein kinase
MSVLNRERWQALGPHLDRALEMADDERAVWLDSLRAEDPALAGDLGALLEERSAIRREGFLETAPPLPAPASLSGQRIGAYMLVSVIGQGGMGTVWLARRSDGRFEGQAAVKLLNAKPSRPRRRGALPARGLDPGPPDSSSHRAPDRRGPSRRPAIPTSCSSTSRARPSTAIATPGA